MKGWKGRIIKALISECLISFLSKMFNQSYRVYAQNRILLILRKCQGFHVLATGFLLQT